MWMRTHHIYRCAIEMCYRNRIETHRSSAVCLPDHHDAQSHSNSYPQCRKSKRVILNYLTTYPFINIELGILRAGPYLSETRICNRANQMSMQSV